MSKSNFHQIMRGGSRYGPSKTWTFTGQHYNPVRAKRRKRIKECGGIRQYKLLTGPRGDSFF